MRKKPIPDVGLEVRKRPDPGSGSATMYLTSLNAWKVSKHIRRLRRKYLSVDGEYGKLGVICGAQNRLRMRGKYLTVFGIYAERIYAYMEKTQSGSWRILLIRQET
jgi:hypothetical protein